MIETVEEVLSEALATLRKGWTKGRLHRAEFGAPDSYCMLGALERGVSLGIGFHMNYTPERCALYNAAADVVGDVLKEQYPDRFFADYIPNFNDHPDTTFDEVEAVMQKAIMKASEL